MNRMMKKVGILSAVFITAIAVYFMWEQKSEEKSDTMVYTSMEEASLPVVYTEMFGKKMNLLHGYTQDMKQAVSREALTVLSEDGSMDISVSGYGSSLQGIEYEVRSLDLSRLVERTSVAEWKQEEGEISVRLPIQNLLKKDKEYL